MNKKYILVGFVLVLFVVGFVFWLYNLLYTEHQLNLYPLACENGALGIQEQWSENRIAGIIAIKKSEVSYKQYVFSIFHYPEQEEIDFGGGLKKEATMSEIAKIEYLKDFTSRSRLVSTSTNYSINNSPAFSLISDKPIPETEFDAFVECFNKNIPSIYGAIRKLQLKIQQPYPRENIDHIFEYIYNRK